MQLIRSEAVYQESMHKYVNKTHWAVDDRRRANRSLCIMLLPYFRCCVNRIVRFKLFPVEQKEEGCEYPCRSVTRRRKIGSTKDQVDTEIPFGAVAEWTDCV